MERVSVKEFARRHRLSIYQVIKKINNGELQSETITENGSTSQYVILENGSERDTKAGKSKNPSRPENEEDCIAELRRLRDEVAELRRIVEICCPHRS